MLGRLNGNDEKTLALPCKPKVVTMAGQARIIGPTLQASVYSRRHYLNRFGKKSDTVNGVPWTCPKQLREIGAFTIKTMTGQIMNEAILNYFAKGAINCTTIANQIYPRRVSLQERATTIQKWSRAKWSEARDTLTGDDIVWTAWGHVAAEKRAYSNEVC